MVKPAAPAIMATGVYARHDAARQWPADAADRSRRRRPGRRRPRAGRCADPPPMPSSRTRIETIPTLLFRGLDGASRAIRLGLVERIEDVAIEAVSRAGGRLSLSTTAASCRCSAATRRCPTSATGRARAAARRRHERDRLRDRRRSIDIHELSPRLPARVEPGPIAGVLLVEERAGRAGRSAIWLFAQAATPPASAERPLCLLDGRDPWMRDVLRPIVEQAGYRVDFAGAGDARRRRVADPVDGRGRRGRCVRPGAASSACAPRRGRGRAERQHLSLRSRRR